MRLLVTGGAGFIARNFVEWHSTAQPDDAVTVLDKLTYAGNLENFKSFQNHAGFRFVHGDIAVEADVREAMEGCDAVMNFAAESHVDRSLEDPTSFLQT